MSEVYKAFWRWHFYAGLIVMPVLMLMALTGGLYLFRGDIDDLVYRPLMFVEARSAQASPDAWVAAARAAVPGRVMQIERPKDANRSARLVVQVGGERGPTRDVFVDPHTARVLGDRPSGGVMATVKGLHSLSLAGPIPNLLIEVVAGWAIVMVATGLVLWWPRGQGGGVVTIRGAPKQRLFWRDLHAVTGLFVGGIILFLSVTGMPWSAVWGAQARKIVTAQGWGRPLAPSAVGGTEDHSMHGGPPAVPWALQESFAPTEKAAPLPIGKVMAHAEALGLPRPYTLSIPKSAETAWSAAYMPDKVEATRTLYLDPSTGQALADMRYGQFGGGAKAIEWGIAVHQGQQFGPINKLVMLAGCIGVWMLGISGLVMWWKRRPKGALAAPARPLDRRAYGPLAAVVVPLAVLYPLVGASLIAVLGGDILVRGAMRKAKA